MSPDETKATVEAICREAIERLLRATSMKDGGNGLSCSFFFGHIGARMFERRMGTEIFFDPEGLTGATLFVRQHGPAHLRQMEVRAIQSLLQTFIMEHFWPIGEHVMFKERKGTLTDAVPWLVKNELARYLAASPIFSPEIGLTLYPLVPITVQEDFDGTTFSFLRPAALTHAWLGMQPKVLIPIPSSKTIVDSPEDFRTFKITQEIAARVPNATATSLLRFIEPRPSSREEGGSRDPEVLYPNMTLKNNLPPGQIILIDDIMTSGGHFIAASWELDDHNRSARLALACGRSLDAPIDDPFTVAPEDIDIAR